MVVYLRRILLQNNGSLLNQIKNGQIMSFFLFFICFYSFSAISTPMRSEKCRKIFSVRKMNPNREKIRETSKDEVLELWKKNPEKKADLFKKIFTERKEPEVKRKLLFELAESNEERPEILRFLAKELLEMEEFETEESRELKQKIIETIRKKESKDAKMFDILAKSLGVLKEEKHSEIRREIYSLFRLVAKNLQPKTGRRLAEKILFFPAEEKIRIIEVLKAMKPKDTLTIQWLEQSLDDSNP